ncbi:MAG: HAD family phosphatase [Polyangiaceae bacterium]
MAPGQRDTELRTTDHIDCSTAVVPPGQNSTHSRRSFTMLEFDASQYNAVIFDCDGTLVDTMPIHHDAWKEAFSLHSAPFDFPWDRFVSRAGMTLERTVIELNREFGCSLDPDAVALAQRAAYAKRQDDIRPIVFVTEFARTLRGRCPLGVASGSRQEAVLHALRIAQIADWFDVVVTATDVEHGKPWPDVFLLAAQRLGRQPERCLVVEDGLMGVKAAHRAGMDVFLVDRCGSNRTPHRAPPVRCGSRSLVLTSQVEPELVQCKR